ncbi:hypothetical protein CRG98_037258 [Punica granatum]|uniref:Uncharacterized protein n=1 Tax=Punica granatum TaxID=22663 RepID=A0A2I0IEA2_PUNGR|nr:hypothetical protein CRG98_037258 [Punica granatum]
MAQVGFLDPTGTPGKIRLKPFQPVFATGHGGSGQPRDPSRWSSSSFGSKGFGLTPYSPAKLDKTQKSPETNPIGKSRVKRCNGGFRWLLATRLVAHNG